MSCANFNANTNPKVIIGGSIDPNFCHTNWPTTLQTFIDSITGTLPDNYSTFLISDTAPGPADYDKVWIAVNSSTCQPIGMKLYLNGTWVDIGATVFYGVDTSPTVNQLLVTSTTPTVNWSQTGQTFLIKVAAANTGAVTVTLQLGATIYYNAVPVVKFGSQALVGTEFFAGQVIALVFDGTNFQILNPSVNSNNSNTGGGTTTIINAGNNLSFEDDIDGDGKPDQWEVYVNGATVTGMDGAQAPNGGQFFLDATDTKSGSKAARFKCTAGAGNGGGFVQTKGLIEVFASEQFEFTFWIKASIAGVDCSASVLWFDKSKNYISIDTPWVNSSTTYKIPAALWVRYGAIIGPIPATAKYCKIRIFAGLPNNDVAVTGASDGLWIDGVSIGRPQMNHQIIYSTRGTYYWKPPDSGAYAIRVTEVGGGGGGGYNDGTSSWYASGGGSGSMITTWFNCEPISGGTAMPYLLTVGAGGAGGTSVHPTGFPGTISSFSITGVGSPVITAGNGTGGGTASTGGGSIGGGSVNPTGPGAKVSGDSGVSAAAITLIGVGGNSPLGSGGQPGASGFGYGGGGGGPSGLSVGGAGSDGCVIIEW